MPQITLDSGAKVEVADQATATLIQTTLDSLMKRIRTGDESQEKLEGEIAQLEVKLEKKEEELEELKTQTSDSAIQQRVDQVVVALGGARKIAGKSFSCDSMDPLTIKRVALDAAGIKCKKYATWDKAPDAYVSAFFDAAEEQKENEDENPDDPQNKGTQDSHNQFAKDLNKAIKRNTGDANQNRAASRQAFLDQRYGNKGDK